MAAEGHYLNYCANEGYQPQQREHDPAQPSTDDSYADRSVGTSYHDVDAYVVALAKYTFGYSRMYPVVDGAGEEHKEHAYDEEDDSEGHLPALLHSRPYHPDGRKGKDGSNEMAPGVALLVF